MESTPTPTGTPTATTTIQTWIEKYRGGIDTTTATPTELGEYVTTRLHEYTEYQCVDLDLWASYKEDFEGWRQGDFKKLRIPVRAGLRKYLLKAGVYVKPHGSTVTIPDTLVDLLDSDEPYEWTDDWILKAIDETGPMQSMVLRRRLNSTRDGLAGQPPAPPAPAMVHQTPALPVTISQPPAPATVPQTLALPAAIGLATPPGTVRPTMPSMPIRQPSTTAATATANHQAGPSPESHQQITGSQPLPESRPTSTALAPPLQPYSREVTAVGKAYDHAEKYSGSEDSFDYKLKIFLATCHQNGLGPDGYTRAFPHMLTGTAANHYYSSNLFTYTFTELCNHLRNYFEGPGYHRENLTKWNALSLQSTINENPGKPISECLQLLVDQLLLKRHTLSPELRHDVTLVNKLVTACQGVPACSSAISNPPA